MSIFRRKEVWVYIVVALVAFAYGAWFRSHSLYQQFDTGVPDDAAYYAKPALNVATGFGSSFDGIHPTNGYQPLWFLTLVAFFKLLPLGSMTLTGVWYAALILQAGIVALATAVLARFLTRLTQHLGVSVFLAFLPLLLIPGRILNLLETPLQFLLLSWILLQLYNLLERPAYEDFRERLFILGISTGLLFLARTDGIFMYGALLIPLATKFRRDLRRLLWFIVPALSITACYFATNYAVFGSPMPVSGSVKMDATIELWQYSESVWNFVSAKLAFIFGPGDFASPYLKVLIQLWAFLVPISIAVIYLRKRILSNRQLIVAALGVFLMAKYLGYTVIYHGSRTSAYWYWVIDVIIWLIIFAAVLRWILEKKWGQQYVMYAQKSLIGLTALATIGCAAGGVYLRRTLPEKPVRDTSVLLDLAAFVNRSSFFSGKRLGAYNSGILGYFSNRPLTNLDGLINSVEYARIIKEGQRDAWIKENIDVLIEYHSAYVDYYTNLGFSLYNIRSYIDNPVPYTEVTGDDYRVYVRNDLRESFEAYLASLPLAKSRPITNKPDTL